MSQLKILLAIGSPGLRQEVKALLRSLVGASSIVEAADGREALLAAERSPPQVALLEALLPKLSGISVARALKARRPQVKVLLVSPVGSPALVRRALEAGADGYLLYSSLPSLLADSLKAVEEGAFVIEQDLLRRAMAKPQGRGRPVSAPHSATGMGAPGFPRSKR